MGYATVVCIAICGILGGATPIKKIPPSAWNQLNSSVDGRLGAEYPMGASCYLRYEGSPNPHINITQCVITQAGQSDTEVVQPYPQGYVYATWPMCMAKSQSCNTYGVVPADPITPVVGNCEQGSVPDYYIDAQTDSDIKAGLAFASKHGIPLVIKASGHDYKGRSAGQGALEIWLYNYKPVLEFQKNFIPAGASSPIGSVITLSAGHSFGDVLSFADGYGGTVVSGTSATVHPAGGYLQGGGHSPLSPAYGLAVDNAYQIKAILANGTSVTTSRQQYPELFYALRGGGGGTFAVVTELSTLFHPAPASGYQYAEFTLVGLTETTGQKLLQVLIANAEQWSKDGFGGYAFPSFATNHTSLVVLVTPKLTLTEARTSLEPLTDFVESLPQANVHVNSVQSYPSYYEVFQMLTLGDSANQGQGVALSSRLIPVANFQGKANQKKLLNAMYPISQAFGPVAIEPLFICITAPPYANVTSANAQTSSVTPAWRNSLWHVIAVDAFDPEMNKTQLTQQFKTTHDAMHALRALTPSSGAYQNEADVYEPDPVGSYWGQSNYNQLMTIKKVVDPTNLLTCWDCIGSMRSAKRFSCYLDPADIE